MGVALNAVLQFIITFVAAHLTVDNDIPDSVKTLSWVGIVIIGVLYAIWQCLG